MKIKLIMTAMFVLLMFAGLSAAEDDHDHDHDHDHAHAGHGAAKEIGDITVGSVTYGISLHGKVTAGKEAVVTISVEKGKAPGELRTWVGVKNGRGSVKALLKADKKGGFHGHLEVPATLPAGSALWIEVVTDSGRERGSVALPAAGKKDQHHDHGDKDHKHDEKEHDHGDEDHKHDEKDHDHGDKDHKHDEKDHDHKHEDHDHKHGDNDKDEKHDHKHDHDHKGHDH